MYGLDEDHHSSIPTCRTYYTVITMKLHPTMLALPLSLIPLTFAVQMIAAHNTPPRTPKQLCDELKQELVLSVEDGLLARSDAEAIHQRCLRDFT